MTIVNKVLKELEINQAIINFKDSDLKQFLACETF